MQYKLESIKEKVNSKKIKSIKDIKERLNNDKRS